MRPASDATWRPEMACTFPGPDSYASLFLFCCWFLLFSSRDSSQDPLTLHALTRKSARFQWCPEQEEEFNNLTKKWTSAQNRSLGCPEMKELSISMLTSGYSDHEPQEISRYRSFYVADQFGLALRLTISAMSSARAPRRYMRSVYYDIME